MKTNQYFKIQSVDELNNLQDKELMELKEYVYDYWSKIRIVTKLREEIKKEEDEEED